MAYYFVLFSFFVINQFLINFCYSDKQLSCFWEQINKLFQMSTNFLQRFKGKTQTISKDGVHNILGGAGQTQHQIYTHSNGLQINKKINQSKQAKELKQKKITDQDAKKSTKNVFDKKSVNTSNTKQSKQQVKPTKQKQKQPDNPFLISNPFYLDEEQRKREEQQRKRQEQQRKNIQKQQRLNSQLNKNQQDAKKGTYSSLMSGRKDSLPKRTEKQWTKMGGLGPNLGGQQWQQKRKKVEKMQQFANQVKIVNSQKGKVVLPPPLPKRQQKKDNPRTKALQYSKNVPKPVIKSYQKQEQGQQDLPIKQISQNQLSELQMYELKHRQLKEMLKNQM